jgi:hypothetical protein
MSDDTKTQTYRRPIQISPETMVAAKLGGIVSGVVCIVMGTIFVWGIKTNSETALSEIKAMRQEMAPCVDQVKQLWWEREQRLAAGRIHGANP